MSTTLSLQLQIDLQQMIFHLSIVQSIAIAGCDFIAQCILVRIVPIIHFIHLNL